MLKFRNISNAVGVRHHDCSYFPYHASKFPCFIRPLSTYLLLPFMGFGAYLVGPGFYSGSAEFYFQRHLSHSEKLVRNLVLSESSLFDSMGTAHLQLELQRRVSKIVKEQEEEMDKQSEIQPSLTEEDMKNYLSEVIGEVKQSKN